QLHERRQRRAFLAARRGEDDDQRRTRGARREKFLRVLRFLRCTSSSCIDHRMYRDRSSFFTMSASIFVTYASSIVTVLSPRSGPSNEISSSSFSSTVARRGAPMFSVRSLPVVAS